MNFRDRLRAFEQRCQDHISEFRCPVHLCLGQEDVPVALREVLNPEDWLFSTHRNHGHYLAKGGNEQKLWDEITGLESGINQGWAGSQCYSDPAINFHATAMVGGLIGVAVGTALALKKQRRTGVVVCCIGDGATEQGVFWEALNAVTLWHLPIMFIIENNGYSVHAPIADRQARKIWQRVESFGLITYPTKSEYCQKFITAAYGWARSGEPACVEVVCERECNHVGNMPDFRVGDRA
jgi:pyruvate dehydrogenase E1 component alpha subunit